MDSNTPIIEENPDTRIVRHLINTMLDACQRELRDPDSPAFDANGTTVMNAYINLAALAVNLGMDSKFLKPEEIAFNAQQMSQVFAMLMAQCATVAQPGRMN